MNMRMRKDVKVGIGLGMTIALENYQNIKPYVYVEAVAEVGESVEKLSDDLYEAAEAELEAVAGKLLEYMESLSNAK